MMFKQDLSQGDLLFPISLTVIIENEKIIRIIVINNDNNNNNNE